MTVSISNVPEITQRVCVPRAVFIQYPFGRLLGDVGNREGQRHVCDDMLEMLGSAQGPNSYRHLPYAWPEPPDTTQWRPDEDPPLGKYVEAKGLSLPETLVKALQGEVRE